MEKRMYGRQGEMLSVIGFGGIVVTREQQSDADDFVAEAIHAGINYFDVAPGYGDAQEKLGKALKGRRHEVFLACKTEKRLAEDARAALEQSLKLLHTDYFDLYQLHGVATMEDARKALGPGGAAEVLIRAKEEGLVRHLGFSAHLEEAALFLMDEFPFESVLFPFNWHAMMKSGFGEKVLQKAEALGVTRLALKAMAYRKWTPDETPAVRPYPKCWYRPVDDENLAGLALRYTLSRPVTAAIPPGDVRLFRLAVRLAEAGNLKPLNEAELNILRDAAQGTEPIFTS